MDHREYELLLLFRNVSVVAHGGGYLLGDVLLHYCYKVPR